MRALIYDGTRPTLALSHPAPEPGPGEALIRTLRAGVSRADIAICHGLFHFKGVLGHEFVGVVEAVGPDADVKLKGRRVVGAVGAFCGKCDMCQAGLRQHCRERTMLGMHGRDGCFADQFVLPAANLIPVPDSVDDDQAVFAEPLAAAQQAVRQLTIEGKPYITVLGDGALALMMVQLMAKLNASVRLVGQSREKMAICEKWGIKHRPAEDVGRRADQDVVVDCTDDAAGLDLAMRFVRPRGTILLKSVLPPSAQLDLSPLVLNEITLIGSHAGPLNEAVALLARGEIDVVSLISRRVSLDDGPSIITGATQDAIKVLVDVA